MKYGERLRIAREAAGLTQAQLSEKIDGVCSQENISKLERTNATGSSFTTLFAMACGVNHVWLALGKGEMLGAPTLFHPKLQKIIDLWPAILPEDHDAIVSMIETLSKKPKPSLIKSNHNRNTKIG